MKTIWRKDALMSGMNPNAFKLGTVLTLGWFWMRVKGCCVLYRGVSMNAVDFCSILAVSNADDCEIQPGSVEHNAGTTYFYLLRRLNSVGDSENTLGAAVKVSINSQGQLSCGRPNSIPSFTATQTCGDRVLLEWYYCPLNQESKPAKFNIYWDCGQGQVNYENPIAVVAYKGRVYYRYQSEPLQAGSYLFCIRTVDSNGTENNSLAQTRVDVTTIKPAAINITSITAL